MKIICFFFLQISTYSTQLNTLIQQFLSDPKTENLNVSVSVRKADNQEEIFAYNPKMAMPPASTIKLLTTATGLEILGKDFRFQTKIFTTGEVKEGILYGDVLIEASSDPSFGSKRFGINPLNQITDFLKSRDIKLIKGKVKVVGNSPIKVQEEWMVSDIGNYYGAFPGKFNYNENYFSLFLNGGKKLKDSTQIANITPISRKWNIRNNVLSAEKGTGDNVNILNLPFSNDYVFSGTIPVESKNFEIKGAIADVEPIFLDLLAEKLDANKISIEGNTFEIPDSAKTLVGIVTSPSLYDISLHTNHRSVNFFADGIGNYLLETAPDSLKDFDSFYKNYWKSQGVNISNFRFLDGSGLSTLNTFSTGSMTQLLSNIYHHPIFNDFYETIPIVGKSGSVASLDSKNISKGRIHAKSGSISGVRNYSGYFKDSKNQFYTFSVYLSGMNGTVQLLSRQFLENLLLKMIDLNQE